MTALFDILQLKVTGDGLTGAAGTINVYWFRLIDFGTVPLGNPVAQALSNIWNTAVMPDMRSLLSATSRILFYDVVNYGDPTDFAGNPSVGDLLPESGNRLGESLSLNTTLTFRYTRPGPGTRSGFKRISGMSETDLDGITPTPGFQPLIDAFATQIASNLATAAGVIFEPVVATGVKVLGVNPTFNAVSEVVFAGIGSQNSRKVALT